MQNTAAPQTKKESLSPKLIETKPFTVNGQAYIVLKYAEGRKPDFAKTMEIAEEYKSRGLEMLTLKEVWDDIWKNDESKSAFKTALGEVRLLDAWGYVRDPESEEVSQEHPESLAAIVKYSSVSRWFGGLNDQSPLEAAPVVVLKYVGRKTDTPEGDSRLLVRKGPSVTK
jgi:hypothetical protein